MSSLRVKKSSKQLHELIEELIHEQKKLTLVIEELRKEHEELKDEIKIQNFVLNSIPFRTEVLN